MFFDTSDLKSNEIMLKLTGTAKANPEKNYLPAYYFDICLLNGTRVGTCDLRIGHNEKTLYGGNIGYTVFKEYRGHKYAKKACELLKTLAKKHQMECLYITCDPDNIASYKTCELLGGEFLGIKQIPINNNMYKEGKRQARVYIFKL